MSIKLLAIGNIALDFVVGKIIEYDTNGDKTKIAARATEAYTIAAGLVEVVNGDPSLGINTISTSLLSNEAALAPYEQQAISNLMALAGQEASLLQGTAAGQIIGLANQAIADAVLQEVEAVCVKEGATVPTATAAVGTSAAAALASGTAS